MSWVNYLESRLTGERSVRAGEDSDRLADHGRGTFGKNNLETWRGKSVCGSYT